MRRLRLAGLAVILALVSGCVLPGYSFKTEPGERSDPSAPAASSDQPQGPGSLKLAFTGEVMELIESSTNVQQVFTLEVTVVPKEGPSRTIEVTLPLARDVPAWDGMRFADLAPGDAQVTVKLTEDETERFARTTTVAIPAGTSIQAVIDLVLDPPSSPQNRPVVQPFVGHEHVGYLDGIGMSAKLSGYLDGMTLDADKNLYIADQGNHLIRKVSPNGVVTTFAGVFEDNPGDHREVGGYVDGPRRQARFLAPTDVVFDAAGNLYVSDNGNNRIRRITPAGDVQTLAGSGDRAGTDGAGLAASFSQPGPLAMASNGTLYVADENGVRTVSAEGNVATFVPMNFQNETYDLPDSFGPIADLLFGPEGELYVLGGRRLFKVMPESKVFVVAGTGSTGSVDAANPLEASFLLPSGMAFEGPDSLLVADGSKLRRVSLAGDGVTTLQGAGGADLDVGGPILRLASEVYYVNGGKAKLFF